MIRDYTSSGPYPLTCLAWVALTAAYAPASKTLQIIGARKPSFHSKMAALEEEYTI
jgi:hypothetical protein